MRLRGPGAWVLAVGLVTAASAAPIPNVTTTPSHTPTATPTVTPTPTQTPTSGPTVVPTAMPTPFEVQGAEFFVNEIATSQQHDAAIAPAAGDGFVVVWTDDVLDNAGQGIFARRFDKTGVALSGDFQVNTTTTGLQYEPAIASDAAGNFIVVWTSRLGDPGDADVYARRFDASGTALGSDFRVNTYTTGDQKDPRVAADALGNFAVVWTSAPQPGQAGQDGDGAGIYGQQVDSSGDFFGPEFLVNVSTTGDEVTPAIALDSGGAFMVVWTGPLDAGRFGVLGRIYDPVGTPGSELVISGATGNDQSPDVGALSGQGEFVVAFEHYEGTGPWNVFGRIYRGFSDAPEGSAFRVNTEEVQQHTLPRVGAAGTPFRTTGFVVTWQATGQDDPGQPGSGIYAQRFDNAPFATAAFYLANPHREGSEYQVNTFTSGDQSRPAISMDERGQFVVAWDTANDDDASSGIVARRFGFPQAAPASVDRLISGGSSNHNGVLEPGERVVVATAWHNTSTGGELELHGTLGNFVGPGDATYSIDDETASYGTIAASDVHDCTVADDCYEVTVSGARPAQHWDATADETLASDSGPLAPSGGGPARVKTWPLHIGHSFADVPDDDPFYPDIENIFHNGVTVGGACAPLSYCPGEAVLRQQMAVFLLKSIYGAGYTPPPATGSVFSDVSVSNTFASWIEELGREGIAAGCAAPPPPELPAFCPTSPVNRQQMAVFLLKTRNGGNFEPDGCTQLYDDVPCSNPFAPWVWLLDALQVTVGCSANPPLYCPYDQTPRKQMATFLVKTFQLELYGPD